MTEHPITLPLELVRKWATWRNAVDEESFWRRLAIEAARWGADQELEACCVLMDEWGLDGKDLMECRRPKPPSLKELAYDALDTYIYGEPDPKDKERTYNTIRRALEALDD